MENRGKIQTKFLEIVITICKIENFWMALMTFCITEHNISKLEDITMEMIQNETE